MITFTPLSGAARSSRTTPLAYLLQVDDVRILLDCGSPDWSPEEEPTSEDIKGSSYHWEEYCQALREFVGNCCASRSLQTDFIHRCAPTIDLVLLSHGDLAHSGLYPYAYSRWNLKAPAYTTLPVQAMGRIAITEEIEGIREEQDVGDEPENKENTEGGTSEPHEDQKSPAPESDEAKRKGKYVATLIEVQDAFDSINTLRYSQPTHLQGLCSIYALSTHSLELTAFVHREMPRLNNHAVQRRTYPWWYHMENSISILRNDNVRREHEPHARTTPGWYGAHATGGGRCL